MGQDIQSLLPVALKLIADQNNLKLIADQNKLKDIQPAGWVADRVPSTGAVIYQVSAVQKDQPNGPIHSVVIDDQGKTVDLKSLSTSEKVDFFPPFPRPGAEDVNPPVRSTSFAAADALTASVIITPSSNDLHLDPGEVFTEQIHVTIPAVPDLLFDVYFLTDTTSSMGGIIGAVKAGATAVMNELSVQFPTMAFGVGNYKDFPYDPYCFKHQLSPTTDLAQVSAAINAWVASGGCDGPEGQLFALNQIATTPIWRPGAQRIVVWFGDAPGHEPICAGLPGVPTAIDLTRVIDSLLNATPRIKVLAISTNTGYTLGLNAAVPPGGPLGSHDYPCPNTGTADQATHIAEATGGSHTLGVNAATICQTIIDMVTAAANLFNNINLVPFGATAPFVTSIAPAGGYGPVDNTGHDYVFTVTFIAPPCNNTDQVFTGTLAVIGDGHRVAAKRVHLTVLACERWSYGVKFLCGYVKETPPGVVPLTPDATLRPGIYATDVNILNYHRVSVTVHKYLYPLMLQTRPRGREPRSVGRYAEDVITLPGKSATFDDCFRMHELLHEGPDIAVGDAPLSICFLEIVSPVELTVTAVYTANDLRGVSVALEVVQVEGKQLQR
jgi:hypothetical protein